MPVFAAAFSLTGLPSFTVLAALVTRGALPVGSSSDVRLVPIDQARKIK